MRFLDQHGKPGECQYCGHENICGIVIRESYDVLVSDFFCTSHRPFLVYSKASPIFHTFIYTKNNPTAYMIWDLKEIRE